jgi:hypothetical protein
VWPTAAGAAAQLETARRAEVTLRLPFAVRALTLNGAALPPPDGSRVSVLLPGPGHYALGLSAAA